MAYAWAILFVAYLIINGVFAYQTKNISGDFLSMLKFQLWMIPLLFAANLLISYGYKMAYKHLDNMTMVVSTSKFFDMVALLVVSYFFFTEVPTLKTFLGLGLVVAGLIIAKL